MLEQIQPSAYGKLLYKAVRMEHLKGIILNFLSIPWYNNFISLLKYQIWPKFDFVFSLFESPTKRADPLLSSYSDYEDSVYGIYENFSAPFFFYLIFLFLKLTYYLE